MTIKNPPLLIGILLPIVMIAVISIVIFLPKAFIDPQHDFIYASDAYYDYGRYEYEYVVEQDRVALKKHVTRDTVVPKEYAPDLYIYDIETDSSKKVSLEEVQAYTIDSQATSPDGYIVRYAYSNNGIFDIFGSSDSQSGFVIEKDGTAKKLKGMSRDMYYNNNFKFIGWIK